VNSDKDTHPVNVGIHVVFVPLIYITAIILVGLSPKIPLASNIPSICPADIGVAVYAIGYILLEPVAGVLMLPFHIATLYYAHVLPSQFPKDVIAKYAGVFNVISWIAQFAGHAFAEGRAPALVDNLFQVCSVFQLM
jgi:2-hydroxy fatty acid dioxygenase